VCLADVAGRELKEKTVRKSITTLAFLTAGTVSAFAVLDWRIDRLDKTDKAIAVTEESRRTHCFDPEQELCSALYDNIITRQKAFKLHLGCLLGVDSIRSSELKLKIESLCSRAAYDKEVHDVVGEINRVEARFAPKQASK
jgi:hypothetical protein